MKINFVKYQGAGNDFILFNGKTISELKGSTIKNICDQHFGIGADGLIVLKECPTADYEMAYYNADGNLGSMCGNGARCAAVFAFDQQIVDSNIMNFKASDGMHTAIVFPDGLVKVSMTDVRSWTFSGDDFIIDTGSPHYIKQVVGLDELDVKTEGKKIRNNNEFKEHGINVNFVEEKNNQLFMRTYERGVEDETLACGTGTVAVAICSRIKNCNPIHGKFEVPVNALGGNLKVIGEFAEGIFRNIYLIGPAQKVFEGTIEIV